ncbi:osmotin-like protein [Corylus avellana]|uniref:osmotin-like protein n=1 Tax=Corylus avellana TaxID=13451 RepID=UPI00286CFEEC|nr:osmotin-like protein [Corylus avellana]
MISTDLLLTTTFLVLCMCTLSTASPRAVLTLVNKCPFTIWPAIQPHSGHAALMHGIGAFTLDTLANVSFPAFPFPNLKNSWYGQIWARTGCTSITINGTEYLSCATGDCGLQPDCSRENIISTPATLAQLQGFGKPSPSFYDVNLVHGFNLPITLTAHGGKGIKHFSCPTADCTADLLQTCPEKFKRGAPGENSWPVVACYNLTIGRVPHHRGVKLVPSWNSKFFESACPNALTNDTQEYKPSTLHSCEWLRELKIIFCN